MFHPVARITAAARDSSLLTSGDGFTLGVKINEAAPILQLSIYLGIYALSPIVNGFPSTVQDVFVLPLVLATTRVFPDALGVGVSRSQVIMSLLPSILVSIAMCASSAYWRPVIIPGYILPVKCCSRNTVLFMHKHKSSYQANRFYQYICFCKQ